MVPHPKLAFTAQDSITKNSRVDVIDLHRARYADADGVVRGRDNVQVPIDALWNVAGSIDRPDPVGEALEICTGAPSQLCTLPSD